MLNSFLQLSAESTSGVSSEMAENLRRIDTYVATLLTYMTEIRLQRRELVMYTGHRDLTTAFDALSPCPRLSAKNATFPLAS